MAILHVWNVPELFCERLKAWADEALARRFAGTELDVCTLRERS